MFNNAQLGEKMKLQRHRISGQQPYNGTKISIHPIFPLKTICLVYSLTRQICSSHIYRQNPTLHHQPLLKLNNVQSNISPKSFNTCYFYRKKTNTFFAFIALLLKQTYVKLITNCNVFGKDAFYILALGHHNDKNGPQTLK